MARATLMLVVLALGGCSVALPADERFASSHDVAALADVPPGQDGAVEAGGNVAGDLIGDVIACAAPCDDANPCTTDACATTGSCTHIALVSGSCSDGDACTEGETCQAGVCSGGTPASCQDDSNLCTDSVCDLALGCTVTANNLPCDDGNKCTEPDFCSGGKCGGTPIAWQATAGSKYADSGFAVVALKNGGIAAAGASGANVQADFWLGRYDAGGNLVGENLYGVKGAYENVGGLAQLSDGGFLLAGSTDVNMNLSNQDGWLVRTTATGTQLWAKSVGGKSADAVRAIVALNDGGSAFVGYTGSQDGLARGWLVRLDAAGNQTAGLIYGNSSEEFNALAQRPNGGFVAIGVTLLSGNSDMLIVATDGTGNEAWNRIIGTSDSYDVGTGIATVPGGFVAVGYGHKTTAQDDGILVRLDVAGNIVSKVGWGGLGGDRIRSLVGLADGFVMSGEVDDPIKGVADGFIARGDTTGHVLWMRLLGSSGGGILRKVAAMPGGGFAMVGTVTNPGTGGDFWVVRTDKWGYGSCSLAGVCKKIPCVGVNPCTIAWCEVGACMNAPLDDDATCVKDNCLVGACSAKDCKNQKPVNCDDGNPCTQDGCSAPQGCTHAVASDGVPCGEGLYCKAGACVTK